MKELKGLIGIDLVKIHGGLKRIIFTWALNLQETRFANFLVDLLLDFFNKAEGLNYHDINSTPRTSSLMKGCIAHS